LPACSPFAKRRHDFGDRIRVGSAAALEGERQRAGREVCRNAARRHDLGPDSERLEFVSQAFGEADDRIFRRVVDRVQRQCREPADRRDIDDHAGLLRAHGGQGRARDVEDADEIGADLALDQPFRRGLERTEGAEAGVVDHDVQSPKGLQRPRDGAIDRSEVDDIERLHAHIACGGEVACVFRPPHRRRDAPAALGEEMRSGPADAGRAPGNQDGFCHRRGSFPAAALHRPRGQGDASTVQRRDQIAGAIASGCGGGAARASAGARQPEATALRPTRARAWRVRPGAPS
jgi:hypothetical protein